MRHLYKKISLEPYKARIPSTLPSYKDGKELIPSETTFLYENPNGVFNSLPSDIQIPDEILNRCNITDTTSVNINLHRPNLIDVMNNTFKYYRINNENWDGNVVKIVGEESGKVYLSYQKLHKWYRFFVEYFNLLNSTTCEESAQPYDCAVTYYYNNNEINQSLEYFQKLDATFISRGGKINDGANGTHCELYDWMVSDIFMTFDIPKKYQNEWKVNKLNINGMFQWYSWFKERFILYKSYETSANCIQALLDEDEETDCCDCKEYYRLGGNEMYYILQDYVDVYFEKAKSVANLSTHAATINIPIQLQTSANVIGELTPFVEEWEGGVDYSNTISNGAGTTIHYGGTSFLNDSSNDLITIQDSIFVSNKTDKGYIQNKYKELTFLQNEQTLYEEYLPTYIKNDKENHNQYKVGYCENCGYDGILKNVDDVWTCPECGENILVPNIHQDISALDKFGIPVEFNENYEFTTYAFAFNKFVPNPSYENMSLKMDIIIPDNGLHFYFIENKIYTSITANTVTIDTKHNIKLIVQYVDNDKSNTPFIEYRGGKYYGYYDDEKKKYKFTFDKKPCKSSEWFDVDEKIYEYVVYKEKFYKVNSTDYSIEIFNIDTIKYLPFYGYFELNNLCLINKIDDDYYIGNVSNVITYIDDDYIVVSSVNVKNDEIWGEKISDISTWDGTDNNQKKLGYYFDNNTTPMVFNFIKPYTINTLDYVTGYTRSKLDVLRDTKIFYDKLGNELEGAYYGTDFFPSDEDVLDIVYHVGNTNDISFIMRESGSTYKDNDDVYNEQKADGVDYYWGNVISDITFYYVDRQGQIVFDDITDINNKRNIMKSVEVTFKDKNECSDPFKENLSVITAIQEWCETYWQAKQIETEIYMDNPFRLCCKITYNIGAIIKRPYHVNGGKFIYGQYQLSKYHKGVQYTEDYYVNLEFQKYYLENTVFYDLKQYCLSPINTIVYYLDEIVDDDSEPYTATKSFFSVEINYNFTTSSPNWTPCSDINSKFSTCLNSTEADGRQMNFYNGFMASPNIMQEYNLGISSLRNVKESIYVDRGVSYAYDRHLKLLEVKSFEALEQYNNGFFNIKSQEN